MGKRLLFLLCREIIWLRALWRFWWGNTHEVTWLIVNRRWGTLNELADLIEEDERRERH